jgi:hypothetical protein
MRQGKHLKFTVLGSALAVSAFLFGWGGNGREKEFFRCLIREDAYICNRPEKTPF